MRCAVDQFHFFSLTQRVQWTHLVVHSLELDFVLETLLELGSTENVLNLSELSILSFNRSVHHLPIFVRKDSSSFLHHLSIVSILVSPLATRQLIFLSQNGG